MKVSIEKINAEEAVVKFELDGETYKQYWKKEENGSYSCTEPIKNLLIKENVEMEEGLKYYLDGLNQYVAKFIDLCIIY